MASIQTYFSGGISRSIIVGGENTVADMSGVNLQQVSGAAVQNNNMDQLLNKKGISPVAIIPIGLDDGYIFDKNRTVYLHSGDSIDRIGVVNAYKGIDAFAFASVADISINGSVLVILDGVEHQVHFGTIEANGNDSRVELDDEITMLPVPTTDYRAVGMNSSFIYFLDGTTKVTRLRLGTDGRLADTTLESTDLPTYTNGEPVGIAVNENGVILAYSDKRIRTGTTDNAGAITFGNTVLDASRLSGSFNKLDADEDRLIISQDNGVIVIPIADANLTLGLATARTFANPATRGFNGGVSIDGGTIVASSGTSLLFGTYDATEDTLQYEIESDLQDAERYGDYIYYSTRYSLGRWKINDALTQRVDMYKSFLIGNAEYHPMYKFYDSLFIGDTHVVAQVREDTFVRKALDIFSEYNIRCIGKLQDNLIIGTEGSAAGSVGSAAVFTWDTISDSFGTPTIIPEKSVTTFIDTGLFTIIMAGDESAMYYWDGYNTRLLKRIGNRDDRAEVLPRHIIKYEGQTYMSRKNRIYSVFGTFINAGDQSGTNIILNGEYKLAEDNNIDILTVLSGRLSCMTKSGYYTTFTGYSDIEFSTRLIVSNADVPVKAKSFTLFFIEPPTTGSVKIFQSDASGERMVDLEASPQTEELSYTVTGIQKTNNMRFIVRIAGDRQNKPVQLLSTKLTY